MNRGFWSTIKKPIFALAPMADVTDAAFRQIIARYGKPDIMWTEFVSVDGLCSEQGRPKLLIDFKYSEGERPIVAQIFGTKPENFTEVAKLIVSLGFDGIDINMGCPVRLVTNQGSCAALIKNFDLAKKIIQATKDGASDLPVSVKTRIGYNEINTEPWIRNVAEAGPAAIIIHGRTSKEMSRVPAHWDEIQLGSQVAKSVDPNIVVLGNGDINNLAEADARIKEFGLDGVMIGRGIFGNPWVFNRAVDVNKLPMDQKLSAMLEHTILFEQMFKGIKPFDIMKKHYKAYVTGFDGAKELRNELYKTKSAAEVVALVQKFCPAVVVKA